MKNNSQESGNGIIVDLGLVHSRGEVKESSERKGVYFTPFCHNLPQFPHKGNLKNILKKVNSFPLNGEGKELLKRVLSYNQFYIPCAVGFSKLVGDLEKDVSDGKLTTENSLLTFIGTEAVGENIRQVIEDTALNLSKKGYLAFIPYAEDFLIEPTKKLMKSFSE